MPKEVKSDSKKKMVVIEEVVDESPIEKEVPSVVTEVMVDKEEVAKVPSVVAEVTDDNEEFEKTNYLWIIIPTALLIGALVGGLITYFSGLSRLEVADATPTPTVSESPQAQASVAPSPVSEIDRSVIKLQVLNGSGVSGLAGKAKTYLEGLGYKEVVVGNASVSNLVETTILVKDSSKEMLQDVISDLSKNYKVAEKTDTLPASSKYDFVITLGSK